MICPLAAVEGKNGFLEKDAMEMYPEIAVEKAMKREEIILLAYAKKISWIEAAEALGMSCQQLAHMGEV